MPRYNKPPQPVHVAGIHKGEEYALRKGREPGRGGRPYRSARDATSINPEARQPIHPSMPEMPPP
ncbi:MAG TPA: hypothetical protein VL361_08805 [Candidatus Limnocylindrales bacterium]|jgi:hypothetical protein|nr:hypothetical protein [Candidatus Limnocylindrales bacterium]